METLKEVENSENLSEFRIDLNERILLFKNNVILFSKIIFLNRFFSFIPKRCQILIDLGNISKHDNLCLLIWCPKN